MKNIRDMIGSCIAAKSHLYQDFWDFKRICVSIRWKYGESFLGEEYREQQEEVEKGRAESGWQFCFIDFAGYTLGSFPKMRVRI